MVERILVGAVAQVERAGCVVVQVGPLPVAVFSVDGELYAVEDYCPHRAGPLSEGERNGTQISCPWHGARFDLRTGSCLSNSRLRAIRTFRVTQEEGQIYVSADGTKS